MHNTMLFFVELWIYRESFHRRFYKIGSHRNIPYSFILSLLDFIFILSFFLFCSERLKVLIVMLLTILRKKGLVEASWQLNSTPSTQETVIFTATRFMKKTCGKKHSFNGWKLNLHHPAFFWPFFFLLSFPPFYPHFLYRQKNQTKTRRVTRENQ